MPDAAPSPSSERENSLSELSAALAEAIGGRHAKVDRDDDASPEGIPSDAIAGATPAIDRSETPGDEGVAPAESDLADDDPCEITPLSIFEAMLFVGSPANEPLTADRATELMRGVEASDVPELVEQLNRRYSSRGCPYLVVAEGAGYRLTLRREFWAVRDRFYGRIREARLSQAAIDVLAIVAYRQPMNADQITQTRGRPSGALLSQLVRRRLLRVERLAGPPRVARYFTTDRFLDLFGLESLDDLPRSDDDPDAK